MKTEIIGEVEKNYNDYGVSYMSINDKNGTYENDERMMNNILSEYEGKKIRLIIEEI